MEIRKANERSWLHGFEVLCLPDGSTIYSYQGCLTTNDPTGTILISKGLVETSYRNPFHRRRKIQHNQEQSDTNRDFLKQFRALQTDHRSILEEIRKQRRIYGASQREPALTSEHINQHFAELVWRKIR